MEQVLLTPSWVHQAHFQRKADIGRVKEQGQAAVAAKDAEIAALLEEQDRLDAALRSIKGHIETATSPAVKMGVCQSVDSATLRSAFPSP